MPAICGGLSGALVLALLAKGWSPRAEREKERQERERLERANARLSAVLAKMQEAVLSVDAGSFVVFHNEAARRMFGFAGDTRPGPLSELVGIRELDELVREVLDLRRPKEGVVPRGSRELAVSATPSPDGGAVLVLRDVTEAKRYETMRRDFVANAAHEIRTPLAVIQGFVETLRGGALEDRERAAGFLEAIDRNVRRLAALVQDMLLLSRLEAPEPRFSLRVVSPSDLAAKVASVFHLAAQRKSLELRTDAPADLQPVLMDPEWIERALANLVANAIAYTPEGGRIAIRVAQGDGETRFEVEDTGIGIAPEHHERVFERFYRVDKSRSRELGGTGLGLAIVKHVAQAHGGSVGLRSAPGRGSTFWFTLRSPEAK